MKDLTARQATAIGVFIGSVILIFLPILAGVLSACFANLTWEYLDVREWSPFARFLVGIWIFVIGSMCFFHGIEQVRKLPR